MPQMAPMSWLTLYLLGWLTLFSVIFICLIMINYYYFQSPVKSLTSLNKKNSYN